MTTPGGTGHRTSAPGPPKPYGERADPLEDLAPVAGPRPGRFPVRVQCQARPVEDGSGTVNGMRFRVAEAARHGDERTTLAGVLQRQRDLVAWKLQDTPEHLGSVATPSGMSLRGLVRHLTNVERSWLRDVFAGQDGLRYDWTEDDPEAEWQVPAEMTMTQLLADYAEESHRCDTVVVAASSLARSRPPRVTCRCAGSCCTWSRRPHAISGTSACCASRPTAAPARNRHRGGRPVGGSPTGRDLCHRRAAGPAVQRCENYAIYR